MSETTGHTETLKRLEGEGLHYQKTRADTKPWSKTCAAALTATIVIGLLIILSMIVYTNLSGHLLKESFRKNTRGILV